MFAALSDDKARSKVAPYLKVFYALAPVVYLVIFKIFSICKFLNFLDFQNFFNFFQKNNNIPIVNLGMYLYTLIDDFVKTFGINYMELGTCDWDQALIE